MSKLLEQLLEVSREKEILEISDIFVLFGAFYLDNQKWSALGSTIVVAIHNEVWSDCPLKQTNNFLWLVREVADIKLPVEHIIKHNLDQCGCADFFRMCVMLASKQVLFLH